MTTIDPDSHLTETVPPKFHGVYRAALKGSRTAAIKAMCLECQGWEDGAVRAVRECPSIACPLHAVRPYQTKDDEQEAETVEGVLLRAARVSALEKARAARTANRHKKEEEEDQ